MDVSILHNIQNPTWGVKISKLNDNGSSQLLWNSTMRLCDMARRAPRNPIIAAVIRLVPLWSNFTMVCPLSVGNFYVRANIKSLGDEFPLRLFYELNSYVIVMLTLYEQIPLGNLTKIAYSQWNLLINKKCKRN